MIHFDGIFHQKPTIFDTLIYGTPPILQKQDVWRMDWRFSFFNIHIQG